MWNSSYPLLSEHIDFLWEKKSEVGREGNGRKGKGREGKKERIIQMYPLLMDFIVL